MKNLKKMSKVVIACYVLAALSGLYALYTVYTAYAYLNSYYAAYGVSISAALGEAIAYMIQQAMTPLSFAVIMFMFGQTNAKLDALKTEAPVEEAVAEEPAAEEPAAEEPVAEEPVAEEPAAEEPVAEEITE